MPRTFEGIMAHADELAAKFENDEIEWVEVERTDGLDGLASSTRSCGTEFCTGLVLYSV